VRICVGQPGSLMYPQWLSAGCWREAAQEGRLRRGVRRGFRDHPGVAERVLVERVCGKGGSEAFEQAGGRAVSWADAVLRICEEST
jgi:hypothetical protein